MSSKQSVVLPTIRDTQNPNYIANETEARSINQEQLEETTTFFIPYLEIKIDKISTISLIFGIIASYFIWKKLGLINILTNDRNLAIIYILLISSFVIQIFTSDITVGGFTMEINELTNLNQLISVFMGTLILYSVFIKNNNNVERNVLYTTIMINTLLIMHINVQNDGNSIRQIRKFKQVGFNIIIFLFMATIYLHTHPSSS